MLNRISNNSMALLLQRQGAVLRDAFQKAGLELASGQKSDLNVATNGDLRKVLVLDRAIAMAEARSRGLTIADGRLTQTMHTLNLIRQSGETIGASLLANVGRDDISSIHIEAGKALNNFESVISALNVRHGGRSVFAGAAADQPAVISADAMLADLQTAISAASSGAGIVAVVDDYFMNPAGGYMTGAYVGSQTDAAPVELAEGDTIGAQIRADDPAIRLALRDLALASLVARNASTLAIDDQVVMARAAGEGMLTSQDGILDLRATLGHAEQKIADALTRQSDEILMFQTARAKISTADPYQTAAEFQAMQGQLQSHYTVVARLSQLSLTNFLR